MLGIKGVQLAVFKDGKPVGFKDSDGYLGRQAKGNFVVRASVPPGMKVSAVSVDGAKNVVVKKSVSEGEWAPWNVFQTTIAVHWSDKYGCFVTRHPQNYFGLILAEGDSFEFWEVSVVSQSGEFFLAIQLKYSGKMYRDGDKAVCPQFSGWPQFNAVLSALFSPWEELRRIDEYEPDAEPQLLRRAKSGKDLAPGTAEVDWWDVAKQMGVLLASDRAARVFVSDVAPAKGKRFAHLEPGQIVRVGSYSALDSGKGSFAWDAKGVEPLD